MKTNLVGGTGSPAQTYRDPYMWGGSSFPSYDGRLEDPSAATPASPAPAATPAASPAASATPAASPAATGPAVDWKTAPAQLRTAYEQTKAEHDKYLAIGKPEDIQSQVTQFKAIQDQTFDLGRKLGYQDDELQEAFSKKPVETLIWLRQQAAARASAAPQRRTDPNAPDKNLERLVDQRLAPVTEYLNQQATDAANGRFETEFGRLFTEAFPEGDTELKEFLFDFTSELMKYDSAALLRLKKEGKVSDIAKYFKQASDRFNTVHTKYQGYQQKRLGGVKKDDPTPAGPAKPGFNLQDIIEGNANAVAAIPSMQR